MTRTVDLYVKDIIQNMVDAEEFIQGLSYETFISDKKTFNAVVRSIEVIGEATKSIPESVRSRTLTYLGRKWQECVTNSFIFILVLTGRLSGLP